MYFNAEGFSQDEKTWRIGVQFGSQNNHSRFSGGMSDANARFDHRTHGAGALNIIWRYDLTKRWMFMTGFGINSFGFHYTLSHNYSLINFNRNPNKQVSAQSSFGALEIPVMGFYKFNPNCKNARWLIGAGFAQSFIGAQMISNSASQSIEGSSNINSISSMSTINGGVNWFLRFAIARERMFKRGSILNASLLFNFGFNKIGESTVFYNVDNQNYTHTFTNYGNFVG